MGTLVIRIPEDINAEYEVSNSEIAEKLFEILKSAAKLKEKSESWLGIFKNTYSRKENVLLGAFEDDAELMDQVVEWAMQARERDPLRYYAHE